CSAGTLRGKKVGFLARHGVGHRILPTELNFRANIYGFKELGVERILSASAVGSLRHEYKPLDIVVPDQFFDRTKGRASTFFGRGLMVHVAFNHPLYRECAATVMFYLPCSLVCCASAVAAAFPRCAFNVTMAAP